MLCPFKAIAFSVCITAATLGLSCQCVSAGVLAPPLVNGSNSANASSWLAGAQAGYNWQRDSLVYGLEADISAMHLRSEMSTRFTNLGPFLPDSTANTTASVNWYGTVRGRLGLATGPVMFYGTGGLAYGKVNLNSNFNAVFTPMSSVSLNSQTSSVKVGWVAGAGVEYMWRPNVILTLGYQYVDLGTANLASSTAITIGQARQSASAHAQFQVVTVGLNWLFFPTDTAPQGLAPKPWEGMYVGGHAGGAWGNSTNANYSSEPTIFISDIRLKRDITLVGHLDDGLGLYRYRYLWSNTVYVGVLAQEVALDHPDAVVRDPSGYLMVDYSKLGLKLMTLAEWNANRMRFAMVSCCSQ